MKTITAKLPKNARELPEKVKHLARVLTAECRSQNLENASMKVRVWNIQYKIWMVSPPAFGSRCPKDYHCYVTVKPATSITFQVFRGKRRRGLAEIGTIKE